MSAIVLIMFFYFRKKDGFCIRNRKYSNDVENMTAEYF